MKGVDRDINDPIFWVDGDVNLPVFLVDEDVNLPVLLVDEDINNPVFGLTGKSTFRKNEVPVVQKQNR